MFWQHRNTGANANSYFNNINGLPRNREIINQPGVNFGGPIIKNKLLFFTNLEFFRYPATGSVSRVVMNPVRPWRQLLLSGDGKQHSADPSMCSPWPRRPGFTVYTGPDHRPDAGPDPIVHA